MQIWLKCLLATLFLLAPTPSFAGKTGIWVYKHSNYRGRKVFLDLRKGQNRSSYSQLWRYLRDEISSIKLVGRVYVKVYRDSYLRGPSKTLTRSVRRLSRIRMGRKGNWNDTISSLIVYRKGHRPPKAVASVTFYKHARHRGASFTLRFYKKRGGYFWRLNRYKTRDGSEFATRSLRKITGGNWNDTISSFKVRGRLRVILYCHGAYLGARKSFINSVSRLSKVKLSRRDRKKCKTRSRRSFAGISSGSNPSNWNDIISSLKVQIRR